MEKTLLVIVLLSFLTFWVVTIIFYTPACFNLRVMIDSIDSDGELTKTKAPFDWYITNFHTLESWIIDLPKSQKYLKYSEVDKAVKRIRICRKIMAYTVPLVLLSGSFLMLTKL